MRPKYWVDGSDVLTGEHEADCGIVWPAKDHTEAVYVCLLLNELDALKAATKRFRDDCELTNTHHNHMLLCQLNSVLEKVHV